MSAFPPMTGAEREIRRLIAERGTMPFRDFMRLALYHADGYYPRRRRIGADARGDYYTSPTTHPAFGATLALQIQAMWRALGRPSPFWIIEPGAGNGELARDLIAFCQADAPRFARAMRYAAIDRAPPAAGSERAPPYWMKSDRIPLRGAVGCVISNELLDAFPVHRFVIRDGEPREIHAAIAPDGAFAETERPPSAAVRDRLSRLPFALPEGFRGEINPEIGAWTQSASAALSRGFVLTIDYGGEADELYAPRRSRGTFQTHYRHVAGSSPYQRIGRQDMTAHVDFTDLIERGANAGLRPVFLTTQAEFLASLGIRRFERGIRQSAALSRAEKNANLRALRQLTQPEGLGGFRVLVQDKNSGITSSADIAVGEPPPAPTERVAERGQ